MSKKEFPCVICPRGCTLEAELLADGQVAVTGQSCPRGAEYGRQELLAPRRTISSSVRLENGQLPLVSVRLDRPVPKAQIFAVMEEIRRARLEAPVAIGDCVIANVLGLGSNVVVTKNVGRR